MLICRINHVCLHVYEKQTLACTKFIVIETKSILVPMRNCAYNEKPFELSITAEDIVCLK